MLEPHELEVRPASPAMPPDAEAFCRRHELAGPLGLALELIAEIFDPPRKPGLVLEENPETGEEYLVLEVPVTGEPKEVAARDWDFARRWTQAIEYPRNRLIHIAFDFCER